MTGVAEPEEPSTEAWWRKTGLREVVAVVVLSATAVLTAWCGFEASKWGGEMSIAFSQASSARVQAGNYEAEARDARQFDLTVYANWVQAEFSGDTALADYIQSRFTPAFATAFAAWDGQGRKENSPLANSAYVPDGTTEAKRWNDRADVRFAQALTDNQRGDDYSLLTVLFALVLFLTAMSQRRIAHWAAWTFLGLGLAVALIGIGVGLTFPIKI